MPFPNSSTTPWRSTPALLLTALLCTTTVQAQSANSASTDELPEDTRAVVNGRAITERAIDNVAEQIIASGQPADRENILDELINLEVLTQAAEEMDLDQAPDVAASLQLQYTQTMANAYLARQGANMQFSEEELRAEYDEQSAAVDTAEYRASHILLDSEEEARDVIALLEQGSSFESLAAERSIDASGETGGDLGWFQAATIGPALADAVSGLDVGETTEAPVATDYGFHVVRLTDRRDAALPDFESVREGLSNLAVRKALARHVEELRGSADIQTLP